MSKALFDDKSENLDGRRLNLSRLHEGGPQDLRQIPLDNRRADAENEGRKTAAI